MIGMSTSLKFFPAFSPQPRSPVQDLAHMIQNIPDIQFVNAISAVYPAFAGVKLTVKKRIIKPEFSPNMPGHTRGCTVAIDITSPQGREHMRVHIYESGRVEYPTGGQYPAVIVNFIEHETAPSIGFAVSNYLHTISL